MALEIVKEIINETKLAIDALLPDYSRLDYEYFIDANSDRGNTRRYGFISQDASFVQGAGSTLGFVTMDHNFQLILSMDYLNKDDDTALRNALNELYDKAHTVISDLQKKPLALPNPLYRVLLINGISFENPEVIGDNSTVILRANLNYRYRFRKT